MSIDIENISIVYTWVDSTDKNYMFKRKKIRFQYENKNNPYIRKCDPRVLLNTMEEKKPTALLSYYNNNEILYSLRSLRKNMPWHKGKIFIVSPNQVPKWLSNDSNIIIVNQDDIVPKKHLPTYNTNIIELYLHKIPGLTDYFIHMNDDYFINKPLKPTDFFTDRNKINVFLEKNYINLDQDINKLGTWHASVLKTSKLINNVLGNTKPRYLCHAPFIFHKDIVKKTLQLFERTINDNNINNFRDRNDIIPVFLFIYTNIYFKIIPYNIIDDKCKFFLIKNNTDISSIKKELNDKYLFFCLNEGRSTPDNERQNNEIHEFLNSLYPNKIEDEK